MDRLADLSIGAQAICLFLLSGLVYLCVSFVQQYLLERHLLPLPPGPKGRPFIGNLPDVLTASKVGEQHLLFEKWARQYGELYKVKVGPFTQYMINSDVAVKQILDKSAGVSANRPPWLVSSNHICNSWYSVPRSQSCQVLTTSRNVLLIDADTPRWKYQRKITHSNVGSIPRADAALPFLNYESLKFMHEVVNDSKLQKSGKSLWNSMMRYTYSNFATQMFGLDVPNSTDPAINYIHETGVAQIMGTLPGAYLVDIFPMLDLLPLALKPWERAGRERFQRDKDWCVQKLERIKAMKDRSAIRESLLCKIMEDENQLGFPSAEEGAYFCLMLTIGAADTSQVSTWSFIEAMMTYPEVQEKAKREVDKVGGDRIPDYGDYEKIPYVRDDQQRRLMMTDKCCRSDAWSRKHGAGDHQLVWVILMLQLQTSLTTACEFPRAHVLI